MPRISLAFSGLVAGFVAGLIELGAALSFVAAIVAVTMGFGGR